MEQEEISTDQAIAVMSFALQSFQAAETPAEIIQVLASSLQRTHLAGSVVIAGPFGAQSAASLNDLSRATACLSYDLREGAWTRLLRVCDPARVCEQSQQLALFLVNLAQTRLQAMLKISTLESDRVNEQAESRLRQGMAIRLERAIERASALSTAVAVFQIQLVDAVSERERLELTALLRESLRKHDQVLRPSLDCTLVLLEGLTQPDSLARIEERLEQRLGSQSLAFCAGVALYPCHARTPERMLGLADLALHEARAAGYRGFYHYGTALSEPWRDRAT